MAGNVCGERKGTKEKETKETSIKIEKSSRKEQEILEIPIDFSRRSNRQYKEIKSNTLSSVSSEGLYV